MEKSIFRQIADRISGGVLDADFSLSDEEDGRYPFLFAPGAFDGMCIYHMGYSELDAEATEQMAAALKAAAKGDYSGANTRFYEWTKKHRTVRFIDDLQEYVLDHAQELDPENVHMIAFSMVLQSSYVECVKVGLALLELFGEPNESLKEIIRRVGLYDEFTIFSAWNMQKWENGNQEIFALAQKTHSWGRIHAVECLKPETDEIRRWLLTEGTVNDVINAYSSLTCWRKSGAEAVLFGHPAPEEFAGIVTLIDGLLEEGPVRGISGLENAENVLLRFLELVPEYSPGINVYETILSVWEWAEKGNGSLPSVARTSDEILHSASCTAAIENAVKTGSGLRLAGELKIPFRDQLLSCMQQDLDNHYYKVRYPLEDPAYVEPVLRLFHEKLPLDAIKGDPVDDPCMGEKYRDYDKLQFLIQELEDKPLTGSEFIRAALESPASRNRYRALSVLQAWVQEKGTALSALLPEIYEDVLLLQKKETREENRKMIIPLLEGRTEFPDEG